MFFHSLLLYLLLLQFHSITTLAHSQCCSLALFNLSTILQPLCSIHITHVNHSIHPSTHLSVHPFIFHPGLSAFTIHLNELVASKFSPIPNSRTILTPRRIPGSKATTEKQMTCLTKISINWFNKNLCFLTPSPTPWNDYSTLTSRHTILSYCTLYRILGIL